MLSSQQAPPPASPAPLPTGLIVGQVVDAESGRAVSETVVTLVPSAGAVNPLSALATALKVVTDTNGRFVFRDLAKGRYSLGTFKPGYVNGAYGKVVPRGPSAQLELAEAERLTDVRIPVWRHAAIVGRVADEAGEPLVGVEIRVRRVTAIAGRPGFQPLVTGTFTTDDRGVYRVSALEPGSYVVGVAATSTTIPAQMVEGYFRATGVARAEMQQALFAAAPTMSSPGSAANQAIGDHVLQVEGRMPTPPTASGDAQAVYVATYHPQAARLPDAAVIALKSGETRTGIDISMRPVPTVRVSGRLNGSPDAVGIATLYLMQASAGEPVAATAEATATTVSDASGAFTFLGVPPGQYELFIVKWPLMGPPASSQTTVVLGPGGSSARGVVSDGGSELKPTYWARQSLSVADAAILGLSVQMHPGLRIAGRIVFEGTGQPPPVQRLGAFTETSAAWMRSLAFGESVVSADGSFTIPGVPAGRNILTVPVPAGWYVKSAVGGGRELSDLPFDLKEDIADVVVTVSSKVARVSGLVRGSDSTPAAGAAVIVFPTDQRYWVDFSSYPRRIRDMRTGRDGAFALSDLPAGEYYVAAVPQTATDWSMPRFFERIAQVATRITLSEGEQKAIDLKIAQVR